MFTQIEITTVCNANCFYCPQDTLPHSHMSEECFKQIVKSDKAPTLLYTTFQCSYLENENILSGYDRNHDMKSNSSDAIYNYMYEQTNAA